MRGVMAAFGMIAGAALLVALSVLPAAAQTVPIQPGTNTNGPYTSLNPYTASDFATGFDSKLTYPYQEPYEVGPIGLAFDPAGNLWVGDLPTGKLYRFGRTGGVANASTMMQQLAEGISGIAFDRFGRMFIGNIETNTIQELNPTTGAVLRTVTTAVPCPLALAFDPVSGDLFAGQGACGDEQIVRIRNAESATPSVSDYVSGMTEVDGISFLPSGTMYAINDKGPNAEVEEIAGTQSPTPGRQLATIASIHGADAMTFSLPVNGQNPQYMYVNRNDGIVTRLDLDTDPVQQVDIMTGGTRGDFATTGPDGCLYPTQSHSVVKIGFNNGLCNGLPTLVPQGAGGGSAIAPAVAPPASLPPLTLPAAGPNGQAGVTGAAVTAPGANANANGSGDNAPGLSGELLGGTLPVTGWQALWGLLGAALLAAVIVVRRRLRQAAEV
jgi:hypothetical protein